MQKNKVLKKKKFTLIELLVVISIIAILAALLLPGIGIVRQLARKTKAQALASSLASAAKQYQLQYGILPPTSYSDLINTLSGNSGPKKVFLDGVKNGNYKDPWKKDFVVSMDTDYDGKVTINGEKLAGPVFVYSGGPDGDATTWDDNVCSWK